ncbi:uncharacterized protein DS421_8g244580 [Arachis hypogaea]|nr:uncharacterized protein DS421_8g244580 [Arachis hypogaea]
MVPKPNYVTPSATSPPIPMTETAVPESSNASQPDTPPLPPIIRMRIWPDDLTTFASHNIASGDIQCN